MPHFKSILSRIVVLHVIAVLITSLAISTALSWLLNRATDNLHNEAMRKQAITISSYLKPGPDGQLLLQLPADLQGLYSQPYNRYSYAILDINGNVMFASQPDRSAIFPERSRADIVFEENRQGDANISGVSLRRTIAGRDLWIQTGENLSNRDVLTDDITAGFFRDVGWITLPILLMLLIIDIVIFRRALLPLKQASAIAQQIGPSRTDIRLPTNDVPPEIRPLLMAVNNALDRLDEGFRVQREFTADAAHELRTPLSVLRARVDLIADSEISKQLRGDIESMGRIVGQLLEFAEVETAVLSSLDTADLQAICADIASFMAPIALTQGKSVALFSSDLPVIVQGNTEMISRAIINLADNAIAHTPKNTAVEFRVEQNGIISIRDFGIGIAPSEHDLIFQRFWRRDRNRPGSTGLGLSIVSRIAEIHGAKICVVDAVGGGACFSISFRSPHGRCMTNCDEG